MAYEIDIKDHKVIGIGQTISGMVYIHELDYPNCCAALVILGLFETFGFVEKNDVKIRKLTTNDTSVEKIFTIAYCS